MGDFIRYSKRLDTAILKCAKAVYLRYKYSSGVKNIAKYIKEFAQSETFKQVIDTSTDMWKYSSQKIYDVYCNEKNLKVSSRGRIIKDEQATLKDIARKCIITYNKLFYCSKYSNIDIAELIDIFSTNDIWNYICNTIDILGYTSGSVVLQYELDTKLQVALESYISKGGE